MLQQTFSTDATTEADRAALCRALQLPPPTPGTAFTAHLEAHGYTAERCWYALTHTTDVSVMIACAALRGVNRLPPDPRLNPAPLPRLENAPARPANRPSASADSPPDASLPATAPGTSQAKYRSPAAKPTWTNDDAVLVAVVPNPKRPGSATYERFKNYVVGRTVRQILEAGSTRGDLVWDGTRQFITFRLPEEQP